MFLKDVFRITTIVHIYNLHLQLSASFNNIFIFETFTQNMKSIVQRGMTVHLCPLWIEKAWKTIEWHTNGRGENYCIKFVLIYAFSKESSGQKKKRLIWQTPKRCFYLFISFFLS